MGKTTSFDPEKFKDIRLQIQSVWSDPTIQGVYVKKLKTLADGRGDLTEIWSLKWEDKNILKPEHIYYNLTDKDITKGWHWHEKTFSQFVCLAGKMQIVLIDLRKESRSFGHVNQFIASSKNPLFIKIPPVVLKGWKALEENSIIINLLSSPDTSDNFKISTQTLLTDIWQPKSEW
ncbi:MAG TPA: dTDP-4-dehydrorhamnose 3,5-epimerase family protein [Patescibacteria group bacterium]|nr:dTDP-4-dehydrorhamnose 3,5-epimerase family protein [Patescibacteria group bacterium]